MDTIPFGHKYTAAPRFNSVYISERGIPSLFLYLTSARKLGANMPKEIASIVVEIGDP